MIGINSCMAPLKSRIVQANTTVRLACAECEGLCASAHTATDTPEFAKCAPATDDTAWKIVNV